MRRRRLRKPAALRAQLSDAAARQKLLAQWAALPPDAADWLAALSMLCGLPFETIAADPRMLPPESIRFFYVDQNWTDALIDGALSIAGVTEQSGQTLAALTPAAKQSLRSAAGTLRRRSEAARGREIAGAADGGDDPSVWSGFLLRSIAVADFPGLQVAAFADVAGNQPLQLIRLDLLSPALMIAIFAGQAARFDLIEPSHILHFGVEDPTNEGGQATVYLRGIGGALAAGVSLPVGGQNPVSVPLRTNAGGRSVIDAAALQTALSKALSSAYSGNVPPATMPPFNAGAFAMQMIAAAERQTFKPGASGKTPAKVTRR